MRYNLLVFLSSISAVLGIDFNYVPELTLHGEATGDKFGQNYFIKDGHMFVYSDGKDVTPAHSDNSGAIYIYKWENSKWEFLQLLMSPYERSTYNYGQVMDLSPNGNVLAVGEPGYKNGETTPKCIFYEGLTCSHGGLDRTYKSGITSVNNCKGTCGCNSGADNNDCGIGTGRMGFSFDGSSCYCFTIPSYNYEKVLFNSISTFDNPPLDYAGCTSCTGNTFAGIVDIYMKDEQGQFILQTSIEGPQIKSYTFGSFVKFLNDDTILTFAEKAKKEDEAVPLGATRKIIFENNAWTLDNTEYFHTYPSAMDYVVHNNKIFKSTTYYDHDQNDRARALEIIDATTMNHVQTIISPRNEELGTNGAFGYKDTFTVYNDQLFASDFTLNRIDVYKWKSESNQYVHHQTINYELDGANDYFGRTLTVANGVLFTTATHWDPDDGRNANHGRIAAYVYNITIDMWELSSYIENPDDGENAGGYFGMILASFEDNNELFLTASHYRDSTHFSLEGQLQTFKEYIPPTPCTTTADCVGDGETYFCKKDENICVQETCNDHIDCKPFFLQNRLPFCYQGKCKDEYEGECHDLAECNRIHISKYNDKHGIGKIKQHISLDNTDVMRKATKAAVNEMTGNHASRTAKINGKEKATMAKSLFNNHNNDAELLDAMKSVLCSEQYKVYCQLEKQTNRRMLQDGPDITVVLSYSIDPDAYDLLVANGVSFTADNSAFEQALATKLNVDVSDISITSTSGEIEIEYVVTKESTNGEPLTQQQLQELNDIQTELNDVTATLVSTFAEINPSDILQESIDYCPASRTCNGRGTCDPQTGVCNCDSSDYWGINCETAVTCNGGTKHPESAYCQCQYPDHGVRCELTTSDCSTC